MKKRLLPMLLAFAICGCTHDFAEDQFTYHQVSEHKADYTIEEHALDEPIEFHFASEDIASIQREKIFSYEGSRVYAYVRETEDNWDLCLDFVGDMHGEELHLLSIEGIDERTPFMRSSVIINTTLSDEKDVPRRSWKSYQRTGNVLQLSYQLLLSDKEKDLAKKQEFEVTLRLEHLIVQTIKKKR